MKWKVGLFFGICLFILLVSVGAIFLATGGRSLVNLYFNYLTQDLPDKKYMRDDFVEREEEHIVSGYYAGSSGDKVGIWTLRGLKLYTHRAGGSVYYYMDTCGLIREMSSNQITPKRRG